MGSASLDSQRYIWPFVQVVYQLWHDREARNVRSRVETGVTSNPLSFHHNGCRLAVNAILLMGMQFAIREIGVL
jgi:hypothetical protein